MQSCRNKQQGCCVLGKYSWSGDGNCQEGVCCILWTEERRQGNLVVEVKYLKEEAEKEGSRQHYWETWQWEWWQRKILIVNVMCMWGWTVRKDMHQPAMQKAWVWMDVQQIRVIKYRDMLTVHLVYLFS